MITPEEKLRSETRICPRCRYPLTSPFTERCPRCLTVVPVTDPGCNKCVYSTKCPVSNARRLDDPLAQRGSAIAP